MRRKEEIILEPGDTLTGITWTGDVPRTNYEVSVDAARLEGNDFFCGLTFPVKEASCSLILGGWGGTVVGLSNIDGFDASDNAATTYMRFDEGRWYSVLVRVTDSTIEAWIDGEKLIEQTLAGHRVSIRPEVSLSRPLGFASWQTKAGLRNARLRRFPPARP